MWIFQRKSNCTNGKSLPGVGWWNVPFLGSTTPDASVKIMKFCLFRWIYYQNFLFPHFAQTLVNTGSKVFLKRRGRVTHTNLSLIPINEFISLINEGFINKEFIFWNKFNFVIFKVIVKKICHNIINPTIFNIKYYNIIFLNL